MHPYLLRVEQTLRGTAGTLTVEQLCQHPEGKWSAALIVEHLGRAFARTADGLQRALDRGAPTPRRPSGAERFRTLVVVGCGYFPSGRISPKEVEPIGCEPEKALAFALESLTTMNARLDAAERQFGASGKVLPHPVLGPLSVRQWRKFHWVHTRHHAKQIVERGRVRPPT